MACQNEVTIGDNVTFSIATHTSGSVLTDADSAPTYRIYEDETATPILTGTMAKLDDANTTGFYTEQIACTAGNGFEAGKSYNIYITAVVGGDTGGKTYAFRAVAALNDLSAADVNSECDTAISDAALATAQSIVDLNDLSAADVNAECDSAISDAALATAQSIVDLNDLSAADVNAECDSAISDAALATAQSIVDLNDLSAADVVTALTADDAWKDLLGLVGENQYIDTIERVAGRVTGYRLRTYSAKGSVGTDDNVVTTVNVTVTYDAGNIHTVSGTEL